MSFSLFTSFFFRDYKSCDKSEDPNLVRVPPQGREDNDIKNNIKLQVKLSDAPLKSPRNCHGDQSNIISKF
jgi:hypothetical protein